MSNNYITNHGIVEIAESIKVNSTLRLLDVSLNNMSRSSEFAAALSDHLKYNNTIQLLGISWNDADTTYVYAVGINNECYVDNTWPQFKNSIHCVYKYGYEESDYWSHCSDDSHRVHKFNKLQFKETEALLLTALICNNAEVMTVKIVRSELSDDASLVIANFLIANKTVNILELSHNKISTKGIKQIIKAIQVNTTLVMLDISHNNITDDGATAISECLKNNNTLLELNLSHNQISVFNICEALQRNTTLQVLNISQNKISDDDVIAIGDTLRSHYAIANTDQAIINDKIQYCVLQNLNMSHNKVSRGGIVTLSDYLKKYNTLQKLVISWNSGRQPVILDNENKVCYMSSRKLGNTGAILISAFYSQNYKMQKLCLSDNEISDDGAVAVSDYLKVNKTIKELDVSNNCITSDGIIKIAEAIQINISLRLLDISRNNIPRCRELATTLSNYLKSNSTLQVLGISWNDTDTTYVYTIGINDKCYVDNTWPQLKWFRNVKHYVHEYDHEEFDYWSQSEWQFSNTLLNRDKLQFNDTEAILLTALVYGNADVKAIEIVNSKISNSASAVICDFFKTCSKIVETLKFSHNTISNLAIKEIMKAAQTSTTLQVLDFSHSNTFDDGVAALCINECLKDNDALHELDISCSEISNTGIINSDKAFHLCRTLQILNISHNNISYDGAVIISGWLNNFNTLQELDISCNKISDSGIVSIGKTLHTNTTLQLLDVSYNNISENGVCTFSNYLKENNTLCQLRISWSDNIVKLDLNSIIKSFRKCWNCNTFGNTGAILVSAFFNHNANIQELDISYNAISDDGVVAISECLNNSNTLQTINLSHNLVTNIGIIKISEVLKMNATIQILNISHNGISDDGAEAIGKCLQINRTLKQLDISYNKVSDTGIIKISKSLQMNTTLQMLDISHNNIGDNGAIAIGETINSYYNKISSMDTKNEQITCDHSIQKFTLHTINMSCNDISNEGIVALSKFLKNNALQELTVSWNDYKIPFTIRSVTGFYYNMSEKDFADIGTILITAFLFQNHKIQTLDISYNHISDDGAIAISEYLKANTTLIGLNTSNNNISNYGIIKIAESMQANRTLSSLDISDNKLSRCDEVLTALRQCLECNSTLQIMYISWDNSDFTYVYTVDEINNECYVKYKWPPFIWSKKAKNTTHYVQFGSDEAVMLSAFINGNTNVKTIKIANSEVADNAARIISDFLKRNKTVKQLKLFQNVMSRKAVEEIMKAIKNSATLQMLKIFQSTTSPDINEVVDFSECLRNNSTLQELEISVSNTGIVNITTALQKNTILQKLSISRRKISNEEVVEIGGCLKSNNILQELNISYNEVSNVGIIGKALQINQSLKILNISHNKISNGGALAISKCLKHNNTLQNLNMSYNAISNFGIINISKALKINTTLQILDISHNKISDKGVFIFTNNIKKKNTLHQLIISWNRNCIYLHLDSTEKPHKVKWHHIGYTGIILVFVFSCHNIDMQELDISKCEISDDRMVAISEYLKNNDKLQKLSISHNGISNIGIIDISKTLQLNRLLQILDVSHNNISDDGAAAISEYLKNSSSILQELDMSYNEISNTGIIHIGNALKINATLQMLNISHNDISDDGMVAIIKCTLTEGISSKDNTNNCMLQNLDISCNKISSNGIVALTACLQDKSTLQKLTISWDDKDAFSIENTNEFCNFCSFSFGNIGTSLLTALLFQCDKIQTLNISNNFVSDDGVDTICRYLTTNNTLKELNMSNNFITSVNIIKVAKAIQKTTLRLLDISYNKISKCREVMTALEHCLKHNTTLQALGISWNDTDTVYVYTAGINNTCYLLNKIWPLSKWINNTVHYVREYYGVEEFDNWLQFDWCFMDDDTVYKRNRLQFHNTEAILLTALAHRNVDVKAIEIVSSEVSYSAAMIIGDFLKANKTLLKLKVSQNIISNQAIEQILKAVQTSTTLQVLDVSHNHIGDEGIADVRKYLKCNKTLTILNIAGNVLTRKGARIVTDFIQENALPNSTDCNGTMYENSPGAVAISRPLTKMTENVQVNTKLQRLDISHNYISDEGAIIISKYLNLNGTLKELNLSDNKITDDGIINIADAIKINATLLKLNISHNSISIDGAVAISECLKINKILIELDISWDGITNKGAVNIGEAIKLNTTLQKLNISYNNISRSTVSFFGSYLKHNSALQELIISRDDTAYTYISTATCCVNKMWSYSWQHGNTQYFIHRYGSTTKYKYMYLMDPGSLLEFSDTEAILLTSLVNNNVQKLKISECRISDEAATIICNFLKANEYCNLQELELSQNTISCNSIELIIKGVQANISLHTLNISSNDMYYGIALAISECIKYNRTLKVLDISKNNITKGVTVIANSIQENTTLLKLFLCSNNISDDGAVAISECLAKNNTLQELSLSWKSRSSNSLSLNSLFWNSADTEGLTRIAEAMTSNTGLHTLDLSSQYVGNDPVQFTMTLLNAMEHNHTIMRLVLPASVNMHEVEIK